MLKPQSMSGADCLWHQHRRVTGSARHHGLDRSTFGTSGLVLCERADHRSRGGYIGLEQRLVRRHCHCAAVNAASACREEQMVHL